MKTADSIEEQPERKAARGDSPPKRGRPRKSDFQSTANTKSALDRKKWGETVLKPWHWQPGQSGNPNGRPKHDLAAEMARAVFENNGPALYAAFTKALKRGNAYAFKELADRAYGKLKDRHEVELGPYREMSEEQLKMRVSELERQLGIKQKEPELLPPADELKPN